MDSFLILTVVMKMGFGLSEARRHHLNNYKTNQGLMHTGEKNT